MSGAAGTTRPRTPPIVSIVGRSGSGKTTLVEKLVRELVTRGYRVAVIKHHRHAGLRVDTPGKDTWRFAQAGADHVMLTGPDVAYHVRHYEEEPDLEELTSCIDQVDLIITEGYKEADTPKIEVIRGFEEPLLVSNPNQVAAVASDRALDMNKRRFDIDDAIPLVDFIEARFIAHEPSDQDGEEGS